MASLRKVKIQDLWRRVFRRKYPTAIKKIKFSGSNIFDQLVIELDSGMSALVGRNGIGKSNLIRVLYNSFISEDSNRPCLATSVLSNGLIEYEINIAGNSYNLSLSLNELASRKEDIPPVTSFMYDPCILIPGLQNLFLTKNFEEILDGYSEIELDQDSLKIINYLTGGKYESVIQVNIEDEFHEFSVLPFFRVKSVGLTYDSRSMGLGELSLFYFFWLNNYLRSYDGNSILFIEEPESFLPPNTQTRLANILAQLASEKGISIFLSSHSAQIIQNFPYSNIHILRRMQTGVKCLKSFDNYEPVKLLGLMPPKLGILLYEDNAAEQLLRSLLKVSSHFTPTSFYYHKSGSEGDILKDLERFPAKLEALRIIAVFDGDSRNKGFDVAPKNRSCFLPSELSPEELLIQFLEQIDDNEICHILNISELKLVEAKESAAGSDHHDYFVDFANSLDLCLRVVLQIICDAWASHEMNKSEVLLFHESIYSVWKANQ